MDNQRSNNRKPGGFQKRKFPYKGASDRSSTRSNDDRRPRAEGSYNNNRSDFLTGGDRLPERKPFADDTRDLRKSDSDYSFRTPTSNRGPRRYGSSTGSSDSRSSDSRSTGNSSYGNRSEGSSSNYNRSSDSRSSDSRSTGGYSRGGSSYGNRSGGGYGNRSGGGYGNRGGGNRNRGTAQHINESKYIKKAEKVEEVVYTPKHMFNDFDLDAKIKKNVEYKGYKSPTPIQDQTIPAILQGRDVLGIANTGTGKTAAFLLPLINKVIKNPNEKALIIVPTRELALQIEDEFRDFSKFMNMYSVLCIGGANIRAQMYGLKRRYNFVIGTPGRLKDLVNRRMIDLSQFNNIVLDEVDRMLDMGFVDDVRYLVDKFPKERQSLFFSATLERQMEAIINSFLKDPVKVSVKTGDTAKNVDQDIVRIQPGQNKIDVLKEMLHKPDFYKVLIFTRTKIGADKLARELYQDGFAVDAIHGDKSQYKRQQALYKFKNEKISILIATDVAARGLDIPNVSHVINYDEPATFEDYAHRIGRTGRANNKGFALTFVGK
ncbi:MAG: DEAD/DEAH box helicase [Candidatus Dojkabacteria bacterium]